MGETARDLPRIESVEEAVAKANELLGCIRNVLSAGPRVAGTLVLALPDKSVDWLATFWHEMRDAVVDDYKCLCDKAMGVRKED